jgi:hypothetical protein
MIHFFKEVLLPLIQFSVVPIVIVCIPLVYKNRELKKQNKKLEEENQDKSLPIQMDLQSLNDIREVAEYILYNTKADRLLILTATNGKSELRFASAIYEQHKKNPKVMLSVGATGKYVRFEFDSEYRKMLKDVELNGCVEYEVEKMKPSDLRDIYDVELVTFSNVYFLMRKEMDAKNDRLFYCSVSTHDENAFTKNESIVLKTAINRLKNKLEEL